LAAAVPCAFHRPGGLFLPPRGDHDVGHDGWTGWVTNGGLTAAYDYEYEGGRWTELDASGEPPFAQAMGQRLVGWESLFNGVNEVVGIKLNFDGTTLTLEVREGEVTT